MRTWLAAIALALLGALPARAQPSRIVSLNLCTDQLVVLLADRENIASVTYLAQNAEVSAVAERARGLPVNHGLAEEVLPLDPDLVFAGSRTTRPTTALLRRLGYKILVFEPAVGFAQVRRNIRRAAAALGESDRGARLIAEMDARLERASRSAGAGNPKAIVFRANGFTVGSGSLVDEVMRAAGLNNLSAAMGMERTGQLPLERLVMADPDLIVLGNFRPRYPSLAQRLLRHPALQALLALRSSEGTRASVTVPANLWTCGGPFIAEAVARLAKERAALKGEAGSP